MRGRWVKKFVIDTQVKKNIFFISRNYLDCLLCSLMMCDWFLSFFFALSLIQFLFAGCVCVLYGAIIIEPMNAERNKSDFTLFKCR